MKKIAQSTIDRPITTDAENERMIAELEKLDTRCSLTPAEDRLAMLMSLPIRQFEEARYPLEHAEPVEACAF